MTEVTVVASSNAGVVGILAHSALQLVGRLGTGFLFWTSGRWREPLRNLAGGAQAIVATGVICSPDDPRRTTHTADPDL